MSSITPSTTGKRLRPVLLLASRPGLRRRFAGPSHPGRRVKLKERKSTRPRCKVHSLTILDHAKLCAGMADSQRRLGDPQTIIRSRSLFHPRAFHLAASVDARSCPVVRGDQPRLRGELRQGPGERQPSITEEDMTHIIEGQTAALIACWRTPPPADFLYS